MQKTIDQAINETADKLAGVINESGLPLSIIKLLLTNTLYQIQSMESAQAVQPNEEAKDAES